MAGKKVLSELKQEATRYIENCINGKDLVARPVPVKIENIIIFYFFNRIGLSHPCLVAVVKTYSAAPSSRKQRGKKVTADRFIFFICKTIAAPKITFNAPARRESLFAY